MYMSKRMRQALNKPDPNPQWGQARIKSQWGTFLSPFPIGTIFVCDDIEIPHSEYHLPRATEVAV